MFDHGAAQEDQPAGRMLLMLNRPADREAALEVYLKDLHTPGSSNYHRWLTPEAFGNEFGPSEDDLRALSQWLVSHGLQVTALTHGRQFVEFSGTIGQVNAAFRTSVHEYSDPETAETRYANATDLQIPTALSPLIRDIAPLNNFAAKPQIVVRGKATYHRATRQVTPLWTTPNPFGTANPSAYLMSPEDWATQYNITPLYQAGITVTGQTIGIINETNIDLSVVQAYQKLFGSSASRPQVVIDGTDPGQIPGVKTEAYLDVELAGAIAPQAKVLLYAANAGFLIDPLELAAIRAVEDNEASVLSVSFGACERSLTASGNQFWSLLWQQAAAQGQTVLVSSGDTGPSCQSTYASVNALASTPWDVAVGGTDFYYSDYATGGASADSLWNATNDSSLGSLKAPLPEPGWSDAFGLNVIADGWERHE
jgi:subtilase family serine protease